MPYVPFISVFINYYTSRQIRNRFITNKVNPELHGLGLQNIKKSVGKYNGNLDIYFDEKVFTLNIALVIS